MADVRSLLRQQRAARQQAPKPQKQSAAPAAAPISKKRKAVDDGAEERKRTRTEEEAGVPAGFFDAGAANVEDEGTLEPPTTAQEDVPTPEVPIPEPTSQAAPLDPNAEADLDAFMNEMQKEPPKPAPTYASGAVIEAKPMTAAEIAAQAREDQSAQRAQRDEEMEGEKEDAARALEDEFEEMEGLEERVKRLREQREALRLKRGEVTEVEVAAPTTDPVHDEEGSDSEDEDWDDWRFRPA
ncbi:hypothetical protein HBH70_213010 [Parastagonospora nodorum]|nr:hypothetical protein HBI79_210060 [Parastagonospora nodorum]KAH5063925.1 hypothetical protein HBH95_217980 [Parastagonospora nodorum]KAH5128410.1 hypothetical protein HBH70_213010 [Parastagonospora nodorum]